MEKVLSGREASDHYLLCFQLILWKQCHWLINSKGFTPELEVIVRDLWKLRTCDFQSEEERGGHSSHMFSSQSEGEDTESDWTDSRSMSSRRSKRSVIEKKRLPKLIETLGLCYLGMLLLRLPVSLGDIYQWVAKEEMIYNRAVGYRNLCTVAKILTYF